VARSGGKNCRVYLGGVDVSQRLSEVNPTLRVATHDRTTFADAGDATSDAGLRSWEVALSGLYDNDDADTTFETLLGTTDLNLSIVDEDANALGDAVPWVLPRGVLREQSKPFTIADLVRRSATIVGSGRAGVSGRLLHEKVQETASGNSANGVDNSASSANGGRGTFHAFAGDGSWVMKIQHSTDNAVWADLIVFTTYVGSAGSESVEVTGTVNRYTRALWLRSSGTGVTFAITFARY